MDFTDTSGVDHPISYWVINNIELRYTEAIAHLIFYGYHDQATRDGGFQPMATQEYHIYNPDFTAYFSQPNTDIRCQAYQYALDRDTFFANATDIPGE